MPETVLTIGHSNRAIGHFMALLRDSSVTAVADVRSVPASRRFPQFNRSALARALTEQGIDYHYLGDALGGRPSDGTCYRDGVLDYELVAERDWFNAGLRSVEMLTERHRPALLCAEREPLDCHRFLLVARHLAARGVTLQHILADGRNETQAETEQRLLVATKTDAGALFAAAPVERDHLARAYRLRSRHLLGKRARGVS